MTNFLKILMLYPSENCDHGCHYDAFDLNTEHERSFQRQEDNVYMLLMFVIKLKINYWFF